MIDLGRYGFALTGPVGAAGAQFLLSLVLLRILDPDSFGRFALLLVIAQFSWGIWSALFCAPLPRLLSEAGSSVREAAVPGILLANLAGVVLALPTFSVMAYLVNEPLGAALAYAVFVSVSLLRWFARALAYAHGEQGKVVMSDLLYALILIGGTAWLAVAPDALEVQAYALLAMSVIVALAPFGMSYLPQRSAGSMFSRLKAYGLIWNDYTRWSLMGVGASELTANAHTYLVAFLIGPAAYAPIAATALLIRPVSVATNALIELERARMARLSGPDRRVKTVAMLRFFRLIIVLIVVTTAALSAALLCYDPRLLYPAAYAPSLLALGTALWIATIAVRVLPFPESALLQSLGAFRPLAMTGIWSALLSCVAVAAILAVAPPIWSIAGVFLGQALGAVLIWREARRWISGIGAP
ncbi:hypothetical protein TPR58_12945 [Sphingomonas sp. HF-S3]|uniref:Polysaccharide biosynthesis protein n=1 Tax=Sphingomonas rustica TaxID=3103142 RepID=A0ABV0BBW1_9SPHN